MKSALRASLMSVTLIAIPVFALAQSNNPTGNMGSNRSETAVGTNVDKRQKPGMGTADAQAGPRAAEPNAAAMDNMTPGATGRTIVPGSNSTVSGDTTGTAGTKTGQTNTSGGGK